MAYVKGLRCRECGHAYPIEPLFVCEHCFGPLEIDYDYAAIRARISRRLFAERPPTMWRYRELLPIDGERIVDLGTGYTPLVRADNLAAALGLKELYLKNDAVNPTYSFKDRVVTVAVSKAVEFGFDTVACASTGNLAGSVAAHAAKAGLSCYIFIPADLERGKVLGTAIYGPTLIAVRGSYDDVNRLSTEIADRYGWAFVNINLRPFYSEGSKTLAYETIEQLGWVAPDHVVVPIAGGSVLTKIGKGLREAYQLGLIDDLKTKISGAQAQGCAPVVEAVKANAEGIRPVKPDTIAKSLAIGNPADGYYALKTIRTSGGYAEAVTDEEIVSAIELLARTEGIFTETAGGVTIGVLKRLVEQGKIQPDERVVAYITGNGLKTLEAVEGCVAPPQVIDASLASFEEILTPLQRSA
ncbi:MAG TPA: threonine synthase [Limnochordia bacterium]